MSQVRKSIEAVEHHRSYMPMKFKQNMRMFCPSTSYYMHQNPNISLTECSSLPLKGAGFSGFWYHMGLWASSRALMDDYDYYCYSSGCLSLLLAFMNTTVDTAYSTSLSIQEAWMDGNMTRYDMVDSFLEDLVAEDAADRIEHFLPRLTILLTTAGNGVEMRKASDRQELVDLLIKTTWIPLFTGNGILQKDGEAYLDGGFSRVLHPPCEFTARVPVTFNTFIHSLNPGLRRETVFELYEMGRATSLPFSAS